MKEEYSMSLLYALEKKHFYESLVFYYKLKDNNWLREDIAENFDKLRKNPEFKQDILKKLEKDLKGLLQNFGLHEYDLYNKLNVPEGVRKDIQRGQEEINKCVESALRYLGDDCPEELRSLAGKLGFQS